MVGRPVKVRPRAWAYDWRTLLQRDFDEAERLVSDPGREAEVAGSNPAEAALVGEKRKEPEPDADVSAERERPYPTPEKDEGASPAGNGETATTNDDDDDDDDGSGTDTSDDDESGDETEWRAASIVGFNAQTGDHQMLYSDGTREWLPLILHETKAEKSDGKKSL